ncbi:MAG TPA: hypothetical protein VG651_02945 [Stellaceae bacterium]|nr:hypothetical protein [Stellaceae bacterium]
MPEQIAKTLRETESRIALQIARIEELDRAGRHSEARRARETLSVITETRDALRLRLAVARKIVATRTRWLRQAAVRPGDIASVATRKSW